MRIQVISDVHAEFHRDKGESFIGSLVPDAVDVLVVAGDLTTDGTLIEVLTRLCDRYAEVVYVPGNHEYYSSTRGRVHGKLEKAERRLSNLHWLRNTTTEIGGQRFVGTTLWFADHPLNVAYEGKLNDFSQIQGFRRWVYEENEKAVRFLKAEIRPTDVVVTHHVPTNAANHPRWRGSDLNRFFVCELGNVIAYAGPKVWCFGHTHESVDMTLGETRLVCNPFGYAGHEENPRFEWFKTMEV